MFHSSRPLCTVACQAPLSVGFSEQEYWSGLPFPPAGDLPHPGIKRMSPASAGRFFTAEPPGKPRAVLFCLVAQLCPTLCNPMDCSPPGSSVHGILQARILEWVAVPPGDLPNPGIEPWSPALKADSFTV